MIIKIPFEIIELESHSYHIIIDGRIDDLEMTFIIDTGASRTIIDKSYAPKLEKLSLEEDTPLATGLAAEQIPVEMYMIPLLEFKDTVFKNTQVLTADLSPINKVYSSITGKIIGGLIGCDFLLKNLRTIDLKKKYLTLQKKQ